MKTYDECIEYCMEASSEELLALWRRPNMYEYSRLFQFLGPNSNYGCPVSAKTELFRSFYGEINQSLPNDPLIPRSIRDLFHLSDDLKRKYLERFKFYQEWADRLGRGL